MHPAQQKPTAEPSCRHEARAVAGSASMPHTGSWVAGPNGDGVPPPLDSWRSSFMAPRSWLHAARLSLPVTGRSSQLWSSVGLAGYPGIIRALLHPRASGESIRCLRRSPRRICVPRPRGDEPTWCAVPHAEPPCFSPTGESPYISAESGTLHRAFESNDLDDKLRFVNAAPRLDEEVRKAGGVRRLKLERGVGKRLALEPQRRAQRTERAALVVAIDRHRAIACHHRLRVPAHVRTPPHSPPAACRARRPAAPGAPPARSIVSVAPFRLSDLGPFAVRHSPSAHPLPRPAALLAHTIV